MRQIERGEQTVLINWCDIAAKKDPRIGMIFHIPNGGSRNPIEAANFKRMGVKAGVPDLFLPAVGDGGEHGLWIELKSPKGRPTERQLGWHVYLMGEGYRVAVCRSWQEGAEAILAYLGHPKRGWL